MPDLDDRHGLLWRDRTVRAVDRGSGSISCSLADGLQLVVENWPVSFDHVAPAVTQWICHQAGGLCGGPGGCPSLGASDLDECGVKCAVPAPGRHDDHIAVMISRLAPTLPAVARRGLMMADCLEERVEPT
jgi:hypothetical protein